MDKAYVVNAEQCGQSCVIKVFTTKQKAIDYIVSETGVTPDEDGYANTDPDWGEQSVYIEEFDLE